MKEVRKCLNCYLRLVVRDCTVKLYLKDLRMLKKTRKRSVPPLPAYGHDNDSEKFLETTLCSAKAQQVKDVSQQTH